MKTPTILAFSLLSPLLALAAPNHKGAPSTQGGDSIAESGKLVTVVGADPAFAEVLKTGAIQAGARFSKGPVKGSQVRVNHALLEAQTGKAGDIPKDIGLHTQGSGGIKRKDFANWTRWYQEDGNVQMFRLFKGEQSARDGIGETGKPGRVEVFTVKKVTPGEWREWQGTYTIIEPIQANIFQLFHEGGQLWAFHIRMSDDGTIYFSRRRPEPGKPSDVDLGKDMTGKSLSIKVRSNGKDYEVFCKNPANSDSWDEPVAKGSYKPAEGDQISFRWGMYCGSKIGQSISKNAMLLVNGVTIR